MCRGRLTRMWRILAVLLSLIPTAGAADLHIATWNLEWLVSPATAHASRLACDGGRRAQLPCDVARRQSRDSADFARLASYARRLDADIVAFQEVEDVAIAERIFRGYRICVATGQGVQHAGFAVRKQIPHRCEKPLVTLAVGGRHRHGAVLTVLPQTAAAFTLLSVHLKSGCATAPLDSGTSCETLAKQGDALASWIRERPRGARFMVLGDFNRVGPDDDDPFWATLQRDSQTSLRNAARGEPFHNCFVGQPFWQFIDHIVLSPGLAPNLVRGSFRKMAYGSLDALRYRLSDHCPVSIRVRTGAPANPIDKS